MYAQNINKAIVFRGTTDADRQDFINQGLVIAERQNRFVRQLGRPDGVG